MRRAFAPLLLAAALASCRDRGGAPPEPPFPGLALELTPDPVHGDLAVEVRLSAEHASVVTELGVAWGWADTHAANAVVEVVARDAAGDLPLAPRPTAPGPDRVLALSRPPSGALSVRYRARPGPSRFAVRVAKDRMSAVGHAFLLLPRVEGALPTRIRFHLAGLGPGAEAASSFGFGAEVRARATMEELGHAAYLAGKLWLEQPEPDAPAHERGKSLVILGPPSFDGRSAYRLCAAALVATDRLLGGSAHMIPDGGAAPMPPEEPAFTFLLAPEPGLGSAQDGAYLTRSFALWFDGARGLDPEIRLTVAHELLHRWLGGAVRLVEADGRDATWFTEGFAMHFARRALLDSGLARPAEMLADVRRTLGEAPGEDPLPPEYRRGAQWAALLDASVQRESDGARGLEDVVRDLVARARAEGKIRLPVAALREALGPKAAADLDRLAARPYAPVELPETAFGPCFRRTPQQVPAFELGFAGLHGGSGVVHEVLKGSAAERAGLREGMVVTRSKVPEEREALQSNAEVELTLDGRRGGKKVRYRPVGKKTVMVWETAPCAR